MAYMSLNDCWSSESLIFNTAICTLQTMFNNTISFYVIISFYYLEIYSFYVIIKPQ